MAQNNGDQFPKFFLSGDLPPIPSHRWTPPQNTHESIQRHGSPAEKYLLAQIDDLSRRIAKAEQTIKKPLRERLRLLLKERILKLCFHRVR